MGAIPQALKFVLRTGLEPWEHLRCRHNGSGAQGPVRQIGDIISLMQRTPGEVSPLRPTVPCLHLQGVPRLCCASDLGACSARESRGFIGGQGLRARALRLERLGQILAPALSVTEVTSLKVLCASISVKFFSVGFCED